MDIFHYAPSTGEFVGTGVADPDPKDESNWLVPANATALAPPEVAIGQVAVWDDGSWATVPDHRGQTWWNADGNEVKIDFIGDPSEAGLTDQEPPAPPPEPRTEGSFREFMALFSDAEQDAIYQAEAVSAADGDFTLKKWMDRARGGASMRLNHPDTQAGVGMLVAAGLLTQQRADAILGADFDAV